MNRLEYISKRLETISIQMEEMSNGKDENDKLQIRGIANELHRLSVEADNESKDLKNRIRDLENTVHDLDRELYIIEGESIDNEYKINALYECVDVLTSGINDAICNLDSLVHPINNLLNGLLEFGSDNIGFILCDGEMAYITFFYNGGAKSTTFKLTPDDMCLVEYTLTELERTKDDASYLRGD